MAYCHDCGAQVADQDIFCPYCGVSLEPVSLSGAASDPALENTISNEPSPVQTQDGPGDPAEPGGYVPGDATMASIPVPKFIEEEGGAGNDSVDAPGEESVDLHEPADTVDEPAPVSFEAGDTPAHTENEEVVGESAASEEVSELASEQGSSSSYEMAASTGSEDFPDPAPFVVSEETADTGEISEELPAIEAESPEAAFCGEKVDEVELEPEAEVAEISTSGERADDEQVDREITAAAEIEVDNSEPENEAVLASDDEVSAEPDQESAPEAINEPPPPSTGDLYSEITPFADEGISRPLEALEIEPPRPSLFDSVRIMDSDPRQAPSATPSNPSAEEAAPQPDAAKSYTTPNMGGSGDTDGKRSKLKPLDEGTILNNRYEIVRKIGGGGMGAVYLASDNNLGGVLRAVKEMVQTHIEEEQQDKAINDFKRESMILSTLDHPSIPTIYDYFFDDKESRFYLVMKYISGGDLSSRLRSAPEGKIDERTITEWAIQIADVLDYLHNRPATIVYRDLKPSNVMLDGNNIGRVMLIDFGIARSINQIDEKGVTAVGTMGYAPPELFSGNVEPRSDIYSLGSTMFHLLTGADPQNNPLLIFDFQKNPRPRQINSQLSDQIELILMRSVEYNAQARFSSAAEMRKVLEDHLENLKQGRVTYGVKEIPAAVSLANQPVFCGFCGQKIVATDMFCAFCGAKQPLSQHGVHSEIYARSAPTARIMIVGTNELDTPAYTIEKEENLVGRRDPMSNIFPEIDLSKFDPQTKISRRHAKIWRDGNSYLVEDLGSSNGTILLPVISDSKRLSPHQPHVLANGDKIRMGDTTLHFVIG